LSAWIELLVRTDAVKICFIGRAASADKNQDKGRGVRQPFDAAFDGHQFTFAGGEMDGVIV
jgi:hypothetical protein